MRRWRIDGDRRQEPASEHRSRIQHAFRALDRRGILCARPFEGIPKGRREGSRAGLERGGRAELAQTAENRKNPADPRPEPQIFKSLAEKSTPETSGENACFPINI